MKGDLGRGHSLIGTASPTSYRTLLLVGEGYEPFQWGSQLPPAETGGPILLDPLRQFGKIILKAGVYLFPDHSTVGINVTGGDDIAAHSVLDVEIFAHVGDIATPR
jgi:hypothetical protein